MKNHAHLNSSKLIRSLIPPSNGIRIEQVERSEHTLNITLRAVAQRFNAPTAPPSVPKFTVATQEHCPIYHGVRVSFGSTCTPASSSAQFLTALAAYSLKGYRQS